MSEHEPGGAGHAGERDAPDTGAMFGNAAGALAFWAALAGAGLGRDVRARRGPDGRCWVEVRADPDRASALAVAAGGSPFAGRDRLWHAAGARVTARLDDTAAHAGTRDGATPPAGRALITATGREELLDAAWPTIDVRHLLGACALRPAPLRAQPEIAVFVPAALARWVLDRSLARGVDTRLAPARWTPLHADAPGRDGVWMHMRSAGEPIAAAWLRALVDLPGVIVARAHDDARLCVDVRHHAPVPEPLLARLVPRDRDGGGHGDGALPELWVLAGPDIGAGRVALLGDWVPGSALLVAPSVAVHPTPAADEARLPAPAPVQIVRVSEHGVSGAPDAVLVDAQELEWLRRFLMARPLGERAYVVPGAQRTLVLVAAETAAGLPLGVPLRRVGPGALYLEHGLAFAPPLPEPARAVAFGVGDAEAVAITREGAWRFRASALVPAWTMWAGPGPRMRAADGEHAGSLRELADAFAREAARVGQGASVRAVSRFKLLSDTGPVTGAPVSASERARLRDQAAADLLRGELAGAAAKLERAGDPAAAARLYERAARLRAGQREEPR